MADVYNPWVAKCVISGTLDGQLVQNALYFENLGDGSPEWNMGRLESLNAIVASWLNVDLCAVLSNQMSFTSITSTQLKEDGGLQAISPLTPPAVGDVNSEAMPNNVALCATITTAERGRAGRGRIYLAGLGRSQTEQSRVLAGPLAAINGKLDDLLSAAVAADFRMGVYSRYYKKVKRDLGKFTAATGFAVLDSVLDSQRRRLPGRGV